MDASLWPDLSPYRCAVWESPDGRAVLRPIVPSGTVSDTLLRALDRANIPHSITHDNDYAITLDARVADIDWVANFDLARLRRRDSLRQPALLASRHAGPFACAQWYWVCESLDNDIAFDLDDAAPFLPLVALTVTEEAAAQLSSRYRPVTASDAYNFVSVDEAGIFIAVDRSVVRHLTADDLNRVRPTRLVYPDLPSTEALALDLAHDDAPADTASDADSGNAPDIDVLAPDSTPSADTDFAGKRKDFGEKIGGARKDRYERSDALQLTAGLIDHIVESMKEDYSPGRRSIEHEKARRLEQALRAIKRDSVFPKQTKKQMKERLAQGHSPAAILLYDSIRTRVQPNAYPLYDPHPQRGKYYVYMPDNLDSARLAAFDYEMICSELARRLSAAATAQDAVSLLMPALDADRPDRFNRRADAVASVLGTARRLEALPDNLIDHADTFLQELRSLDTIALLARVLNMDKLAARQEFSYSRVTSDPAYSFQLVREITRIAVHDIANAIEDRAAADDLLVFLSEVTSFADQFANGKASYTPSDGSAATRAFMTQLVDAYRNGDYPVNETLRAHLSGLFEHHEPALLPLVQAQAGVPAASTRTDENVAPPSAAVPPDAKNPVLEGLGEIDSGRLPSPRFERLTRTGPACRSGDIQESDLCDRFGLRGIEYGNWVSQNERQDMLNMAYDSMYDLSLAMGVPESFIGFHGQLALALGARGRGGNTAAHYEPARKVVNMTKTAGAGAFAHEWAHALDHHLGGTCLLSSLPASVVQARVPEMEAFAKAITLPSSWSSLGLSAIDPFRSAGHPQRVPAARVQRQVRALLHAELRKNARMIAFRYEMPVQLNLRRSSALSAEPLPADFMARVQPWLDHLEDGLRHEVQGTPGYNDFFLDTIFPKESGVSRRIFRSAKLIERIDDFLGIDEDEHPSDHRMVSALVTGIAFSGFNRLHKQIADLIRNAGSTQKTQFLKDASQLAGKSASYWTSPHELFARAFSAVIHDRLSAQGIKNDYLSLYSAPDIFNSDEYRASSNPEGRERAIFGLAAEPLIAHVQSLSARPEHEPDQWLRAAASS